MESTNDPGTERVVFLDPTAFQAAAVALYVKVGEKPATVQHPVVALVLDAGVITPGIAPEEAQVVIPIPSIDAAFEMASDIRDAAREAREAGSDLDAVGEIRLDLSGSA